MSLGCGCTGCEGGPPGAPDPPGPRRYPTRGPARAHQLQQHERAQAGAHEAQVRAQRGDGGAGALGWAAGPRAHFRRELGHRGSARLARSLRPPRRPCRGGCRLPRRSSRGAPARAAAPGAPRGELGGSPQLPGAAGLRPRPRGGTRPFNPSPSAGGSSLETLEAASTLQTGKLRPPSVSRPRQDQSRELRASVPT